MPKKNNTQLDGVFDWLKRGNTITSLQALNMFGTMRLAAYIHTLRKLGWVISTEHVEVGLSKKKVAQYSMVDDAPWAREL